MTVELSPTLLSKISFEEDRLADDIRARNDLHNAVKQVAEEEKHLADQASALRESIKWLVAEEVVDGKDNDAKLEVEERDEAAIVREWDEVRIREEELDAQELRMNTKIQADRAALKRDRAMEDVETDVLDSNVLDF